jgi:hypothetical protein
MQGDGPLLLSGDIRTQSWIRSSWQLICGVLTVPYRLCRPHYSAVACTSGESAGQVFTLMIRVTRRQAFYEVKEF